MIHQVKKQDLIKQKLAIFVVTSIFFTAGFIINITNNSSAYNTNLNIVPKMQNDSFLGSSTFIVLMNIVSNVFNPVLCAGYIVGFILISYRKLEILVFLIWFIFMSFILSILKTSIRQARPYWISGSEIKMLQWTCYTEYGCPSGHAMMGIILLQFLVRFFSRTYQRFNKRIILFYFIAFIFEFLVMFSRILLGMHSLNQVLFGLMIGLYSMIPYYLFVENWLLRICIRMTLSRQKIIDSLIIHSLMVICLIIEVMLVFALQYDNNTYWSMIKTNQSCKQVKEFKSFQYRCFQDEALIMAGFSILLSLLFIKKPQNLMKQLAYSKKTLKFILRFVSTLICSLIPSIIFLNPFWAHIQMQTTSMAILIWAFNNLGFYFSIICFLYISRLINSKLNFELYEQIGSYQQFAKSYLIEVKIENALNEEKQINLSAHKKIQQGQLQIQ